MVYYSTFNGNKRPDKLISEEIFFYTVQEYIGVADQPSLQFRPDLKTSTTITPFLINSGFFHNNHIILVINGFETTIYTIKDCTNLKNIFNKIYEEDIDN
jgi:hypothetical protein